MRWGLSTAATTLVHGEKTHQRGQAGHGSGENSNWTPFKQLTDLNSVHRPRDYWVLPKYPATYCHIYKHHTIKSYAQLRILPLGVLSYLTQIQFYISSEYLYKYMRDVYVSMYHLYRTICAVEGDQSVSNLWLVKISDRADQHTMGQQNTSAHGIVCIKSAKQRMVMVLFQS